MGCRNRHCGRHTHSSCRLGEAPCKRHLKICHIDGDEQRVRRLSCLGICSGKTISIFHKNGHKEAMIIEADGSKFALDQELYDHIEVEDES